MSLALSLISQLLISNRSPDAPVGGAHAAVLPGITEPPQDLVGQIYQWNRPNYDIINQYN
jgi:hypothetical protein